MARGSSGVLVVVALLLITASFGLRPEVNAQRLSDGKAAAGGELITIATEASDGRQQVTVISPSQQVMSVYHIDSATGGITLKSVRNVRWDMLLDEFNGNHPTPRDIHALLNR